MVKLNIFFWRVENSKYCKHWPAEGGKRMNVLFTKRRSIIAPTARGNYPVQY